jgi:uncharacterized protein
VHVSAMSRNFVADPREVAKPGDVVRVKVLGVDLPRKRISLTLRLDDEPEGANGPGPRAPRPGQDRAEAGGRQGRGAGRPGRTSGGAPPGSRSAGRGAAPAGSSGAMADALRRAGLAGGPDSGHSGKKPGGRNSGG